MEPQRRNGVRRKPVFPIAPDLMLPVIERLLLSPPEDHLRVSVAIPVRNERDNLPRCLAALAAQRHVARRDYEVLLMLNHCDDELAIGLLRAQLPSAKRHVGWARRLAMDEACTRLETAGNRVAVVATTDADTIVAPDWLAATLAEIDAGADLVAGDIEADPEGQAALPPALARLLMLDRQHNLLRAELEALLHPDVGDPSPRHGHQTGASLAVTSHLYRLVGGLPPLPCREDLALVAAARHAGRAIRHSPLVRVRTSVRYPGRARGGMADTLAQWHSALERQDLVRAECASSIERRMTAESCGEPAPEPVLTEIENAIRTIAGRIVALRASRTGQERRAGTAAYVLSDAGLASLSSPL